MNSAKVTNLKQVDILISKNQALQILYLKHHDNIYKTLENIMDKKLTKSTKIWFPQNEQTYPTVQIVTDNTINTNIPYIWPAFKWVMDTYLCMY